MSAPQSGAKVQFCGHKGWFVADIYRVECVNVIRATGPVSPDNLIREDMDSVTHHMVDHPNGGFWRPDLGVFVVPVTQVRRVKTGPVVAEEAQAGYGKPVIRVDEVHKLISYFDGSVCVRGYHSYDDKPTALQEAFDWFRSRSIHVPQVKYDKA